MRARTKAIKVAVAVLAGLALAATVVFAATAGPSASALEKKKRQAIEMRYACALKSNGLMRFVARASACKRREVVLDFTLARVQTCVLKRVFRPAGKRTRRAGRLQASGLRALGATRRVARGSLCGTRSYGRERPLALPARTATWFCAKKGSGRLRFTKRPSRCSRSDRIVVVRRFIPDPDRGEGEGEGNPNVRANPDSGTTNEASTTDIDVLANDDPGEGGFSVESVDTVGTKGTVTLNSDQTLRYDPSGQFEDLGAGASETDTFTYRARKGTGTSPPGTVTVTVNGVNDAPVLSGTESSTLGYVDGSPGVPISPGIAVADVDSANLTGATVRIASGRDAADSLDFTPQTGITGTYDSGTGVLTLTGSASKGDYQAALRSIEFSSSGAPSGNRSVTFQVNDGAAENSDSNVVSRTVAVNRAPTNVALSNSNVDENQPSGTKVGDLSTTDPDAGDTHSYSLVSGAGDANNGSFQISGGELRTAASFDFTLRQSLLLI